MQERRLLLIIVSLPLNFLAIGGHLTVDTLDSVLHYFSLSRVEIYCQISIKEMQKMDSQKSIKVLNSIYVDQDIQFEDDCDAILCLPNEAMMDNSSIRNIAQIVEKSQKTVFLCPNYVICMDYMNEIKLALGHMAYFYNLASHDIYETYMLHFKQITQFVAQKRSPHFTMDEVSIVKSRSNLHKHLLEAVMETSSFLYFSQNYDIKKSRMVWGKFTRFC